MSAAGKIGELAAETSGPLALHLLGILRGTTTRRRRSSAPSRPILRWRARM